MNKRTHSTRRLPTALATAGFAGAALLGLFAPVGCEPAPPATGAPGAASPGDARGAGKASPPADAGRPASNGAAEAPDPAAQVLAGAPSDHDAFLAWAKERLQQRPPAVAPPPPPSRPPARWPVVRLVEHFDPEAVRSDWQADERSREPLLEVGPMRSDQRAPGVRMRRMKGPDGEPLLALLVSGLDVPCEQIGRLALRVRVPAGEMLELRWGRVSSLRLPVASHDEALPLSLSTDGFSEWSGPLRHLELRFADPGDAAIEIEHLRLYAHEDAYPRAADVRRVSLNGEMRSAIYAHPPVEIEFPDLILPQDGRLRVGFGYLPDAESPGPIEMQVVLRAGGSETVLAHRTLDEPERWVDADAASLAQWGGQRVTLVLQARGASPNATVFWGNPTIYQPVDDAPVVVLYLVDTLSAEHCGLYGYERPTTPNFEAFVAEGAWFRNAYANSPVTITSVKDLLLSMPAARHGVYSYSLTAPRRLVPLPEALREAGMATALFSTNVNAGPAQQTDRGFDTFFDRIAFTWSNKADRTVPIAEVMDWINRHRDRPMFLYIHTAEPHAPYDPPPEFAGRFGDARDQVARYDEEVLYADHRFGLLLERLEEAGLKDKAHFLVIADHGEELGEHGNFGHGKGLYNEVLRIPMLARGPRFTHRGVIERPSQIFDIMPTLLELLDLPQPQPCTGASLMRQLTGTDVDDVDRTIICSHQRAGQDLLQWVAVKQARWKLMFVQTVGAPSDPAVQRGPHFELYDLHADPDERNDLAAERPEIVRELALELVRFIYAHPPYETPAAEGDIRFDVEQLEQLRDLGYVD